MRLVDMPQRRRLACPGDARRRLVVLVEDGRHSLPTRDEVVVVTNYRRSYLR